MRRSDLHELCYITPVENVPSILQHGLLSDNRVKAKRIQHRSIAMPEIQGRRDNVVVVPGGRPLHDYVNLYICARNPTMMKMVRKYAHHSEVCILRVSTDVLDIPGTVVTDGNASSGHALFEAAPDGLTIVDRDRTFAEWWTSDIQADYFRRKFQKCAEVLVLDRVPPRHILGAYVSGEQGRDRLIALQTRLAVTINPHLFFQ